MQTYVGDRVRARALVLVAALCVVAAGGPFAAASGRHGPTACTALPAVLMEQLGSTRMSTITPDGAPPGATVCKGGFGGDALVELATRDGARLFAEARAGRPRTFVPTSPGRVGFPGGSTAIVLVPAAPAEAVPVRTLGPLAYRAVVVGGNLYVLTDGYYVATVVPSIDGLTPEALAFAIATNLPARVQWWNPLSWLRATLP